MKRALITGINGQDGSYLAELLLSKGYLVHGVVRRDALEDPIHRLANITSISNDIKLHVGALDNPLSIYKIIASVRPDECYHLASSSFVSYNFEDESSILANNFAGTHSLLSSITELVPECRVYFAGSSEMFGDVRTTPQDESTPFNPRAVYGISKLAAFHLARNYREHRKLFVAAGILYNHESPRRGFQFVTRKISTAVARIHLGLADRLELGNLDARRDWGYAPDYVSVMHAMLQEPSPEDYVVASGTLHTVRDFLTQAFAVVDLLPEDFTRTNPDHFRPTEAVPLCGNATKARSRFGWQPTRTFAEVVREMVVADIDRLRRTG